MSDRVRRALVTLLIGLSVTPGALAQQEFPSRQIRFLVPYPPGGANDTVARILAGRIADNTGQPVIVDNRPGASGAIAGEALARADPDGYTVMIDQSSIVMNPALRTMKFDVREDLAPVTLAANMIHLLAVNAALPAASLSQLVEHARKNPGSLNYSSPGSGSPQHVIMEMVARGGGFEATHVPYKGGAPAMMAVVANEVQMTLITVSTGLGQIRAGKARALAVLGPSRSASLPDVPTFAELGYKDLPTPWIGIFAPGKTPPPLLRRLNEEFLKALKSPDVRAKLEELGFQTIGSSAAEFRTFISSEHQLYSKVIREAGIKPE